MKHTKKAAMTLLLAAALLLSGCAEMGAPLDTDTNSNSSSSESESSVSDSTSGSENTDGTYSFDSNSDQSSGEIAPPVPVEFTEEDKELQKILSELEQPANEIYMWLGNGSASFGEIQVRFADDYDESWVHPYYRFGGLMIDEQSEKPRSCAEMETLMLDYFSADRTEKFFNKYFSVCSVVENADGIYTLKNDVGRHTLFIELDGELYHLGTDSISGIFIVNGSEKVISKTDDTIEFTYLLDDWVREVYEADNSTILNDTDLYSEYKLNGTLKYERGGWKLDYLEYPFRE